MVKKSLMPKKSILLLVAICLLAAHFVSIASTWEGMGYTKDEGYYFSASKDNFGWYTSIVTNTLKGDPLKSFTKPGIDRYWRNNHEHPPFCKTMQGLNHLVWHKWTSALNYGNSHRMSTWVFSAFLLVFMLLLATEWLGIYYAIFAIVLLFTLPRVFFHVHINTFDIPVVSMWFMILYAYRKGLESARWSWVMGILLGVGLATKNNCYFIPVLFFITYMYSKSYRNAFFDSVKNIPKAIKSLKLQTWLFIAALVVVLPITFIISLQAFAYGLLFDLLAINLVIAYKFLKKDSQVPKHLAPILTTVFTAPMSFILLWPWIWVDTWQRLGVYFNRHLHPPAWETYYLHKLVMNPPPFDWHYPFVMSWYTVPAIVIFVFFVGLLVMLSRGSIYQKLSGKNDVSDTASNNDLLSNNSVLSHDNLFLDSKWDQFFLLMNIVIPFIIIANPKTPIYGGTKHYMTAMPYVAIVCAIALKWIVDSLSRLDLSKIQVTVAGVLLAIIIITPGVLGIKQTHPHTLSYYNELMGGSIKAPEVGMQRTFWAQSTCGVLQYLNKVVPPNGSVMFNNTPWHSIDAYKRDGLLRSDIKIARNEKLADFAVLNHWKFYTDGIYRLRKSFGARYAEFWTEIDGMPLTEVIRNNNKAAHINKPRKANPPK